MRVSLAAALFLLVGCAGVREPAPIAEQHDLGVAQITNGTADPSIKNVRALRYNDHVARFEECFLLDGHAAPREIIQSARAHCQAALTNALAEFEAKNIWKLSGLHPEPAHWSSSLDTNGTLSLKASVTVTLIAR